MGYGPRAGKSSGRIATFRLWTGMFRDGISSIPGETVIQNKYTNCKGVKNNTNFGQITGIQWKLDTTCK